MDSGIYIYTFASGAQYVGQAINIASRWEQHKRKMHSGKHTKLVQAEFDKYSFPQFEVVIRCHPHYLDAMEAVYIHILKPVLNTSIPKMYESESTQLNVSQSTLNTCAYDLLPRYDRLVAEIDIKETELMELEDRVREIAYEKLPDESKQMLRESEQQLRKTMTWYNNAKRELTELEYRVKQYNQKSWWHRLWNKI